VNWAIPETEAHDMAKKTVHIPWHVKIVRTVQSVIDQVGNLSGVPLEIIHVPTGEGIRNNHAASKDFSDCPVQTEEVRIGSSPILLVRGFLLPGTKKTILETALRHVCGVVREYLQSQAEIEGFAQEILENYQVINMLYRVSDALGNIHDPDRVASVILDQAVATTHAEKGTVLLLEGGEQAHLRIAASHGFPTKDLESLTIDPSDAICSKVLQSGEPLIVEDVRKRPDLASCLRGGYRTGSFISLPLYITGDDEKKQFLGVLNLSDKMTAESFKSNDLKLLNALSSQASVSIANAQALTELKRSKEELDSTLQELMRTYTDLEKRSVIIEQINKIALSINATLDLDKIFEKVCLYAKNITNAEDALVFYGCRMSEKGAVPETEERSFAPVAGTGTLLQIQRKSRLFSETLDQGKPVFLESSQEGIPTHLLRKDGRRIPIRNLLGVSFFNKEDTFGVMVVVNKISEEKFTQEDFGVLKTLGNQAANAVENARLIADQKALFMDTIQSLAAAVDAKDPYTHNHSRNVSQYSRLIAREMGLSEQEMEILERAAILHDIGKIAIPESILNKPERLTREEFEIMKTHPLCGVRIVENIKEMQPILPGMKYHHERYDGKGYPDGLKGEEIPLMARILAVADTYDAITSDRPYRKGPGHEFAVFEISRCSGTQFAPEVVEAFLRSPVIQERLEGSVIKT